MLSIEQVQHLCAAVPPRFAAFILVTTFGSLRWGEATALHRRDIDLDTGIVTARAAFIERADGSIELGPPKSRASARHVALPRPVVKALAAHLDTFVPAGADALICTGPSGRPMRRRNFNKAAHWEQLTAALGVPGLHLHDLRHTGNTLAASTPGTSTRDLMDRMGHDSMRAALIYQHVTRDTDLRIAEALADRMEGGPVIARVAHAASERRAPPERPNPRPQ